MSSRRSNWETSLSFFRIQSLSTFGTGSGLERPPTTESVDAHTEGTSVHPHPARPRGVGLLLPTRDVYAGAVTSLISPPFTEVI